MAMGGYRAKENLKIGTLRDKDDADAAADVLPVVSASIRPSIPASGLTSLDPRGGYSYPRGNRASIEFAKTQEVELLWLETLKVNLIIIIILFIILKCHD